jgi:hypothetical protein
MRRMPQPKLGILLVFFTIREADEFKLHSPRTPEIDPALARSCLLADRSLSHDLDSPVPKIANSQIKVVDVQSNVMAANIAVAWLRALPVGWFVQKYLKIGSVPQPVEPDFADNGAGVDAKVGPHPGIAGFLGSKPVDLLTSKDVHEESMSLGKVGNSEPDMVCATHPGNALMARWCHLCSSSLY